MENTLAQLIRYCKQDKTSFPKIKLSIVGNDATQHLKNAIIGTGVINTLNIETFDADYNQIFNKI